MKVIKCWKCGTTEGQLSDWIEISLYFDNKKDMIFHKNVWLCKKCFEKKGD